MPNANECLGITVIDLFEALLGPSFFHAAQWHFQDPMHHEIDELVPVCVGQKEGVDS